MASVQPGCSLDVNANVLSGSPGERVVDDRRDRRVEAAGAIVWQPNVGDVRNACTAGSLAVRQDGRYPSEEYLSALAPGFGGFARDKVERPIAVLGDRVSSLTAEAAGWTVVLEPLRGGRARRRRGPALAAGSDVLRRPEAPRREAVAR